MYFCVCVVHSTAEAEGGLQADQKKKIRKIQSQNMFILLQANP